jgi:hypothetical protein
MSPCTLCHCDVRLDDVFFRDGEDDPGLAGDSTESG